MFAPSDLLCLNTRCLMCDRWLDQPDLLSIASIRVKLDDKPLRRKLNQILRWGQQRHDGKQSDHAGKIPCTVAIDEGYIPRS